MWKYRIIQSDLGWNIYKTKEENGLKQMWFLGGNGIWVLRKDFAKTFYHWEDAADILGLIKIKDAKKSD